MNKNNYGSLEACKRLVDAGIVLETDFYYCTASNPDRLYSAKHKSNWIDRIGEDMIPAPSLAEMWREFSDEEMVDIHLQRDPITGETVATKVIKTGIGNDPIHYRYQRFRSANPTDALIYLRIWLETQRKEK